MRGISIDADTTSLASSRRSAEEAVALIPCNNHCAGPSPFETRQQLRFWPPPVILTPKHTSSCSRFLGGMPDGEVLAAATHPPSPGGRLAHEGGAQMAEFGQTGGGDSGCKTEEEEEKDPRKIARKYQLDLCKKALEENIIVYLETGCGKTHIAVLLIYELSHLIRQPQKNVCVFLAPTVALVQQQARVIEDSTGFKVRVYSGGTNLLKSHHNWANDIEEFEVLVMTPQILLHSLYHCFIRMDSIALLIFDECHHAQVKSSHPYAEIMKQFYKANESNRPRIFGMTASPIVGKGASEPESLPKSLNSLEKLLDAKVHSVEDKEELERYVASPVVRVYKYASTHSATAIYSRKLNEIKHQCILALRNMKNDLSSIQSTKRLICRMHDNIMFSLDNLGLWGALQASQLLSSADFSEFNELREDGGNPGDHSFWNRYLAQVADALLSDCKRDGISGVADVEILKEPFFSKKILRLIGILSTCSFQRDMKCIIFVNRIITARSLSYLLQNLKFLSSWKCHFLVGVHAGHKHMSRKMMKIILEKFRTGKLNLLVATKVGEEGLDIQTCCLVIRFDLPETVASFIQSRGRARMVQSEYAFLVDSGNQKEVDLIESFREKEERINVEIASRTSTEVLMPSEERIYKVGSSGASISAGYAVSLLHHYCSKLPRDEYFDPQPNFYYIDDVDGTVCHVMLPANAPLHEIVGMPQPSLEAAKKDVSLKAIEELHKMGALNSYLLPERGSSIAEDLSDSSDDEDSVGVLHEMRVPLVLKEAWTDIEDPILNCYHVKFIPIPEDRSYREFCLFVKAPLPKEAEGMEIDLHLAHGRSVMTKIVPLGTAVFSKEEIKLAEYFQELLFKVVLDPSKLVPEYVPLGEKVTCNSSSSTFYLLLPAVLNDHGDMLIDWKIIRRCLSSPIFKNLAEATRKETNPSDINLLLANGCQNINNVKNSFIYVPCKNIFCFVSDISDVKNAHSPYKDFETRSHMQHVIEMYGIHLGHPEQPLLHLKPLPSLHNLLHNRKRDGAEARELEEYFINLPPELCQLKIIGFSKDIGSSVCLLPSVMHRLENLLVAIDLKHTLSMSFPEGAEVSASRVLEALTTEKCQERFSLERLEVLGDAFLKYIVGRHLFLLHDTLDEGKLTDERSKAVNNNNLFKIATKRNLQVYIRDQPFDPHQFFAFGYPCLVICSKETESAIHSETNCCVSKNPAVEVRCSKGHHKLRKKTIADVVEALVGAFLVDSGFKAASSFLEWLGIRVDFEASQVINACLVSKRFWPLADYMDIEALEALLGYKFLHKGLLLQAFVHPSYNKHGGGCYQRLEFLGDALLDFLITSYLFTAYPKLKPGEFTDLRSASASNNALANVAVDRSFQKFLISDSSILSEAVQNYVEFVGSSSERGSLDGPKCPKVLGDLVESCFGAILLDAGLDLDRVWTVMLSFLDPTKNVSSAKLQPLRELRELCQSYNWDLQFPDSKSRGSFFVEAKVETKDGCVTASATNKNKRAAAGIASERMLEKLKGLGYKLESKSLGETLKATCKMDARLIGYDETPIDVAVPDNIWFSELKLSKSFECGNNSAVPWMSNAADFGLQQLSLDESKSSSVVMTASADSDAISNRRTKPHCKGKFLKGTARSRLYEICSVFYWKPPLFECCEAEGPSHMPQFTYKITMEIEEVSDMVLECYGDSKAKKKAAAESAAEAAIWYLQKKGYLE